MRNWILATAAIFLASVALATPTAAPAAEVIPPCPTQYFNDYAGVVSVPVAEQLNRQLKDFEATTSNQVVVAVYPKMQSDSPAADYTMRVFNTWGVGQRSKNNGVVLFVFLETHEIYIQVGYGLEAALSHAAARQIIEEQIAPRFKTGDYDGGLTAGVAAILTATTAASNAPIPQIDATVLPAVNSHDGADWPAPAAAIVLFILFAALVGWVWVATTRRPRAYSSHGDPTKHWYGAGWGTAGGFGSSAGRGAGGGSSGAGHSGGGFSSGGGHSDGGGAGGHW